MTKADIKRAIQALGLTARWSAEYGEWRITTPPGSMHYLKSIDDNAREALAYYTPDGEDAP